MGVVVDSSFWQARARRFRELRSGGNGRELIGWRVASHEDGGPPVWELLSASRDKIRAFMEAAVTCAAALGHSGGESEWMAWLEEVFAWPGTFDHEQAVEVPDELPPAPNRAAPTPPLRLLLLSGVPHAGTTSRDWVLTSRSDSIDAPVTTAAQSVSDLFEASARVCDVFAERRLAAEASPKTSLPEVTAATRLTPAQRERGTARRAFIATKLQRKGWTLSELSRQAALAHASLHDYLSGKTKRLRDPEGLADALGCAVEDLPE